MSYDVGRVNWPWCGVRPTELEKACQNDSNERRLERLPHRSRHLVLDCVEQPSSRNRNTMIGRLQMKMGAACEQATPNVKRPGHLDKIITFPLARSPLSSVIIQLLTC
jgi:hypothetical protein